VEIIEQQAIRAALSLAAASAHAQTPDSIADMREEAAQLISLCIHKTQDTLPFHVWCDSATELLQRISGTDSLPEQEALRVSAAILRLRLVVARSPKPVERPKKQTTAQEKKGDVHGNQKKIMAFIVEHPDIRAKDLIQGLSGALSPRTIKRCLKELTDTGAVQRTELAEGGVSYRV
jgi:hypothetical protein